MPSNPLTRFQAPTGAGDGLVPADCGYLAWTGPPDYAAAGTGPNGIAAGTLQLRRLSIPNPGPLANIFLQIDAAGVGLTANQNFAGVWDAGGAFVGLTADQSAAWAATGLITMPLVANALLLGGGPPFNVDTPYIYVGYWWNTGTSAPFVSRGISQNLNFVNGPAASVPVAKATAVSANAGLTTVGTAPLQLGTLTKVAANFWCAVN